MQTKIDEIVALPAQHDLHLKPESVQLEESGADFLAASAAARPGCCASHADLMCCRAASEARALKLIGPRLPVQIPEWQINAPDLIAYPRLPGTPAAVEEGGYIWHVAVRTRIKPTSRPSKALPMS